MRGKLPLGIAQIGKSFRNEISPRQSLLRLREFYQAEIEVFCNPYKLDDLQQFQDVKDNVLNLYDGSSNVEVTADEGLTKSLLPNKLVAYYLCLLSEFYAKTGIDMKRTRFRRLSDDEKAFYSSVGFDFEVETSVGWLELVACNYRSDYDLRRHALTSKHNLEVIDPSDNSKVLPHVFELSMGIDRSIYAILEHSYYEDYTHDDRIVLGLKPYLAPISIGILPLMRKDGIGEKAKEIYTALKREFESFYDDSGSIGRRYRRLEEIGVPFVVTADKTTMEDDTITVRYRDSMQQERVKVSALVQFFRNALSTEPNIG
jgi:glycyl-tRNA synthetase